MPLRFAPGLLILFWCMPELAHGVDAGELRTPLAAEETWASDGSVRARREMAEAFVARKEETMGRSFDPDFRGRLVETIASRTADLRREPRTVGEDGPAPDALGPSNADLVYTPVTACRVFDTRLTAEGRIAPGATRDFLIAGMQGFTAQGGAYGGCGVPLGPTTA